jgi:hypothetical protein
MIDEPSRRRRKSAEVLLVPHSHPTGTRPALHNCGDSGDVEAQGSGDDRPKASREGCRGNSARARAARAVGPHLRLAVRARYLPVAPPSLPIWPSTMARPTAMRTMPASDGADTRSSRTVAPSTTPPISISSVTRSRFVGPAVARICAAHGPIHARYTARAERRVEADRPVVQFRSIR